MALTVLATPIISLLLELLWAAQGASAKSGGVVIPSSGWACPGKSVEGIDLTMVWCGYSTPGPAPFGTCFYDAGSGLTNHDWFTMGVDTSSLGCVGQIEANACPIGTFGNNMNNFLSQIQCVYDGSDQLFCPYNSSTGYQLLIKDLDVRDWRCQERLVALPPPPPVEEPFIYSNIPPPAPPNPYGYSEESGMDYPSNDITPSDGPVNSGVCGNAATQESLGACFARCDATSNCLGIAHYADNNCCYLKSALQNQTPNGRVDIYKKDVSPAQYTMESGTDYPNNDIYPVAGPTNGGLCGDAATQESVNACRTRCDNTPECVGIAHYADNNCCYLKSSLANQAPNGRVVTYRMTREPAVACRNQGAGTSDECNSILTPFGDGRTSCTCGQYVGGAVASPAVCHANVSCGACTKGCHTDADCPVRYNCAADCGGVPTRPSGHNGVCLPNCGVAPAANGC